MDGMSPDSDCLGINKDGSCSNLFNFMQISSGPLASG